MFGLGASEIVVLAILGGGFVAIILVVLSLVRWGAGVTALEGRVAALEAENRRLREHLDRKGDRAAQGTSDLPDAPNDG